MLAIVIYAACIEQIHPTNLTDKFKIWLHVNLEFYILITSPKFFTSNMRGTVLLTVSVVLPVPNFSAIVSFVCQS